MSLTDRDYTDPKDRFAARLADYDRRLQVIERGHVHPSYAAAPVRLPLAAFRVAATTTQSIASSANVPVQLTVFGGPPEYNFGGGSFANNAYTIPRDGLYTINYSLQWFLSGTTFSATQNREAYVQLRNTGATWGIIGWTMSLLTVGTANMALRGSITRLCTAGQTITTWAAHNFGANYSTQSGINTFIEVFELPVDTS